MEKRQSIQLRLLSYVVIAYMMMAFAWWTILLFTKNEDAFLAKRDKLRLIMAAEMGVQTDEVFFKSEVYKELQQQYQRQEMMILGEAVVFVISLAIGVWLINRGYNKEMLAAQQRRNFLLSITHELKSPLASIRLILETFQKRKLPEEQLEKFNKSALQEVDRLNKLVNDLLLSAKLETTYQVHETAIDLVSMLEEMMDKLAIKYPEAQWQLTETGDTPFIRGDVDGLTSVFSNLLENALKYSPAPAQIEIVIQPSSHFLEIDIADQGIGIPDREKSRIFDKFYRVGNEDTRKTKGTGLGLYIVKQIILAHQGKIQISDNTPQGVRFQIKLPIPVNKMAYDQTVVGGR
ncbi:MAG TPA: HAMP domain-containing sensor histidine kinase [Saprospiraceae bacterium]|nr:HAMP domain-containing sensor histidine kinase [Saprospiraceae bacterium]HMQ85589.1 HAMP domain-containing sensor histidine kinase [Saprospiraceae bacterium]